MNRRTPPTPRFPLARRVEDLTGAPSEKGDSNGDKTVSQLLGEAKEGLMYSGVFFQAMRDVDSLGVQYLRTIMGHSLPGALREWHTRPWEEQVELVTSISGESQQAQKALAIIEAFKSNSLLWQALSRAINEFGRPSRTIRSEEQLDSFLQGLLVKSLAKRTKDQPLQKAFQFRNTWWTNTGTSMSRLVFPFAVMVLGRVRKHAEEEARYLTRLGTLLNQATLENDPEQQPLHQLLIFQDKVGTLVLWDGNSRIRGKEAGFLAVLIGRLRPGSSLVIEDWDADTPLSLPRRETYELPPIQVTQRFDRSLEVDFARTQARLPEKEFESIVRNRGLIRRQVTLEGILQIHALSEGVSQ